MGVAIQRKGHGETAGGGGGGLGECSVSEDKLASLPWHEWVEKTMKA